MSVGRTLVVAGLTIMTHLPAFAQVAPAAQAERAAVRAAIDNGNADYVSSFARTDAQAVARVYAADGSRMQSNGAYSKGHAAIAEELRGFPSLNGADRGHSADARPLDRRRSRN